MTILYWFNLTYITRGRTSKDGEEGSNDSQEHRNQGFWVKPQTQDLQTNESRWNAKEEGVLEPRKGRAMETELHNTTQDSRKDSRFQDSREDPEEGFAGKEEESNVTPIKRYL